jgi:ankyrin repeat protein
MDSFVVARDWRGWTALHTAAKSGQVGSIHLRQGETSHVIGNMVKHGKKHMVKRDKTW